MTYREKFFDPDYRRSPKTPVFCHRCMRDLAEGQPRRFMAYELDGGAAIHADDWEIAKAEIVARRAKHLEPFVVGPIGMDCARRIGLAYSRDKG